jgi:type II secretory pathway predicted ATPase ExeA
MTDLVLIVEPANRCSKPFVIVIAGYPRLESRRQLRMIIARPTAQFVRPMSERNIAVQGA